MTPLRRRTSALDDQAQLNARTGTAACFFGNRRTVLAGVRIKW